MAHNGRVLPFVADLIVQNFKKHMKDEYRTKLSK